MSGAVFKLPPAGRSHQSGDGNVAGMSVEPSPYKNGSILIVDDLDANLIALEAVLEPLGCNLVRASSGQGALKELLHGEFAVLLIDIMMPELDGLATAELIKSRPATRHVPIIFLTGLDTQASDVARGYSLGAVDYLVKPFDPHILRSKVAVFLELFLKHQELTAQTEIAKRREREARDNWLLYQGEREARAEAEAAARAREHMLAVVSHELRTPMTSISMNTSIVKTELVKTNSVGLLPRVDAIERGIAKMNSLVGDLLESARIQSGNLVLEIRIENVASMVGQFVEQLQPLLERKKQTLEMVVPGTSVFTRCDRDRTFQVFANLIGNANKFSPERSVIHVYVSARPNDILFEIIDHGCGIPADHLSQIFDPYWQASQHRQQGLGLGLSIVKGIVEAHGTRIWVESSRGVGCHFFFTLPLAGADVGLTAAQ
jgi:signal transduction histidine kinase